MSKNSTATHNEFWPVQHLDTLLPLERERADSVRGSEAIYLTVFPVIRHSTHGCDKRTRIQCRNGGNAVKGINCFPKNDFGKTVKESFSRTHRHLVSRVEEGEGGREWELGGKVQEKMCKLEFPLSSRRLSTRGGCLKWAGKKNIPGCCVSCWRYSRKLSLLKSSEATVFLGARWEGHLNYQPPLSGVLVQSERVPE